MKRLSSVNSDNLGKRELFTYVSYIRQDVDFPTANYPYLTVDVHQEKIKGFPIVPRHPA